MRTAVTVRRVYQTVAAMDGVAERWWDRIGRQLNLLSNMVRGKGKLYMQ